MTLNKKYFPVFKTDPVHVLVLVPVLGAETTTTAPLLKESLTLSVKSSSGNPVSFCFYIYYLLVFSQSHPIMELLSLIPDITTFCGTVFM